ncbi:MAG: STAS domain-containing protein [Coriobacteriales bacterium]|nr:STAS domain-containing protein [Coriobacteriales bacterium]
MDVNMTQEGTRLIVTVTGRLNTGTAPDFENKLIPAIDGITELIIDFAGLDYISSAGLRIVLTAQKKMNRQGTMVIRNVKPEIYEVFEMTGFVDFLTIE